MPYRVTAFLYLTLVLATACADSSPHPTDAHQHALDQRQNAFFEAMAAKDSERIAGMFSETAVLQVAGMPPIEGRGAIREFYSNLFGFLSATSATPERTHMADRGDMAYSIGRTTNAFTGPQGTSEYTGKYLLVWQNVEDEWLIAAYSISSNEQEADR